MRPKGESCENCSFFYVYYCLRFPRRERKETEEWCGEWQAKSEPSSEKKPAGLSTEERKRVIAEFQEERARSKPSTFRNGPPPPMSLKTFRDEGYLQEVNRQFLHPLGLTLGVVDDRLIVCDGREDPEGIFFDAGEASLEKLSRIQLEQELRHPRRHALLGYVIQPIDDVTK